MLIITTIYYTEAAPAENTLRDKGTHNEGSLLKNSNRKVVTVYQGTNLATPSDSH